MDLVFAPSQIETWPIDRLRPYARNAKIHGDDQVAKIAASMAKFGWTVPCMVADDGELIAGHGRVLAATMLGLKDVPVIRLGHLDEAERRAYRIADNKLTELGEWDEAMLRDEIAGLLAEDFDLSLLGITDDDLDALLQDPDQSEGGAVEGGALCCAQFHPGATLQGRGPLHQLHHQLGKLRGAKPFEIGFVQCFLGHRGHSASVPRNRNRKLLGMTECRYRAEALISLNICYATRQALTWR